VAPSYAGVTLVSGKAMIAAGVGARRAADADAIVAAIDAALVATGLAASDLGVIGGPALPEIASAIADAARRLGVPHRQFGIEELRANADRCLTRSERVMKQFGLPSVAEAAALAAAGPGSRLLRVRVKHPFATAALASMFLVGT
jgi:cobalt-precorrin 5A hydrolase